MLKTVGAQQRDERTASAWHLHFAISDVRGIAARAPGCLYSVPTRERVVALTVDDGADPVNTRDILDVLRAHDARATLFFISSRVPGNEALVAAAVAEGHARQPSDARRAE